MTRGQAQCSVMPERTAVVKKRRMLPSHSQIIGRKFVRKAKSVSYIY